MSPSTFAPLFCARPMKSGEAETLLMNVVGCQPIFVATTSAVIVCVGSENSANTFAPAAFSFTICWLTSVWVASYFSTSTIFDFAAPRPCDEAVVVVLAVGVVLHEDADLRLRHLVRDELCRRPATHPDSRAGSRSSTGTSCTGGPSTSRPSRRAPAAPCLVQVVARRERRRGAEAAVDGEDVILLHELLRQRNRVGRVVPVVVVP